jgi:hypothetical protein
MSSSSGVRDLICKSEVPTTIPFGKSSALAALLQYALVTAHFKDELLVLLISIVEQSWKVETNLSITTVVVEEDAACSLTKTLLRKRVSTTMTVDNVTILGWQKYLVNLLPSCTCDCSLLISVGCKTKTIPKPKSRSEVKSRFLQNKSNILEQQAHWYILQQLDLRMISSSDPSDSFNFAARSRALRF